MSKSKDKNVKAFDERERKRHDRGFANMDPDRQREIASEGGKASHHGGRNPGDKNADTKMKEELHD